MEPEFCVCVREENGRPRIVSPIISPKPDRERLPWAVTTRIPYASTDNGLPAQGERARAADIEDKIIASLEVLGYDYVGHVIADGSFLVIFCGPHAAPPTVLVKTGLLRKSEFTLESRDDPSWSLFELELAVTPVEIEEYRSAALYKNLKNKGDIESTVRDVDFAVVLKSSADREALMTAAIADGFRPSEEPTWEDDLGRFWCELVRTTSIDPPTLMPHVAFLRQRAEEMGGVFDGWGTTIETAKPQI